jgi:hypothetical protein
MKRMTGRLAGDPNNPLRMLDTATADELKAEILKQLKILAPVLELDAISELLGVGAGWRACHSRMGQGVVGALTGCGHFLNKPRPRHGDQCPLLASTGS